jgi:hypothetical protein
VEAQHKTFLQEISLLFFVREGAAAAPALVNDLPISGLRPRSKTSATWQLEADFAIGTTAIAVLVLEVRKLSVESQMMQFSHTQLQIF